jgi:hypothetical protein
MTAPGFEVREQALLASVELHAAASSNMDRLSVAIRDATAQGNLFGLVGRMTGTDATYRAWTEQEATGLLDLARYLASLGNGLRQAAENYRSAEGTNGEVMRGVYP